MSTRSAASRTFGKLGFSSSSDVPTGKRKRSVEPIMTLARHDQKKQKSSRARQILSLGKDKPDPPQAAIVIQSIFPKDEYQRRRQIWNGVSDDVKDTFLAPLGEPDDMRVTQGELIFTLKNDATSSLIRAGNAASDVFAFSCVNGLPSGTRLKFVGWEATENDPSNRVKMDQGTTQIVGTGVSIHTGPYPLPAMSQGYFDETPYRIWYQQGHRAIPVNGVQEIGQPTTKFRPAIYSLTDQDVISLVSKGVKAFEESLGNDVLKEADVDMLMKTLQEKIDDVMADKPPSLPLRDILWVHACQKLLHEADDEAKARRSVSKMLSEKVLQKMDAERAAYNENIGESVQTQGTIFRAIKEGGENMAMELISMRDMLVVTFRNWLQDHRIGLILNHVDPGNPIRWAFRYGSN
jgi:hypothetical protein